MYTFLFTWSENCSNKRVWAIFCSTLHHHCKSIISAHICERNAVMGKPSAMYCIHYHYLQYFSVSRPDSLPVHLTPVVGRTSQIREMLLCNLPREPSGI